MNVEFGSIAVQPGSDRSIAVEVYFRGTPPSGAEFDRMLRDFTLEVVERGSDVHVSATFQNGWRPMLFSGFLDLGHSICRNWQCLEYSSWLRAVEYRVIVPSKFNADLTTSGGWISVANLNGQVTAHTSGPLTQPRSRRGTGRRAHPLDEGQSRSLAAFIKGTSA